jgi:hypothetical protein
VKDTEDRREENRRRGVESGYREEQRVTERKGGHGKAKGWLILCEWSVSPSPMLSPQPFLLSGISLT